MTLVEQNWSRNALSMCGPQVIAHAPLLKLGVGCRRQSSDRTSENDDPRDAVMLR
jgi:hypothetical protein